MSSQSDSISVLLKEILHSAEYFSTIGTNNPPMERREHLLSCLSKTVKNALSDFGLGADLLDVKHGGRQYNYSPVAWLRIFDTEHAPNAQDGYYIVMLFNVDGSAVYLSLNHGTSEFRGNQMRPIHNDYKLLERSTAARNALDLLIPATDNNLVKEIELMWERAPVKNYSKQRLKNYELANIYAYKYPVKSLPTDAFFISNLIHMTNLLWAIEKHFSAIQTTFIRFFPERIRIDRID